ncbi:MAG: cytochrome C oxidase subunit IV family protein [Luteolibacter sp.]
MADTPEAIQKAKKTYLAVFGVLLLGTILTWAVAEIPALDVGGHGFDMWDCILGLCIATVKASCVALIFMHLNHEKKLVYWLIVISVVGAIALFGLTALAEGDPIFDRFFY